MHNMAEMKKSTLIMLIAIVWLAVLSGFLILQDIYERRDSIEYYEVYASEDECMVIGYPKNSGMISFKRYHAPKPDSSSKYGGLQRSWAEFVNENEAIFGTGQLGGPLRYYYRFVFVGRGEEDEDAPVFYDPNRALKLYDYDSGELIQEYEFIVSVYPSK